MDGKWICAIIGFADNCAHIDWGTDHDPSWAMYAAQACSLSVALWVAMTYQAWEADGIRDAAVIAYIVVIIFSSLLLGWRFASVMGGLSVAVIWYFAIMEKQGLRILHVDDPISYARDLSAIIILVGVLIYLLITSWSRTLQSARLELQERLRAEEKLQRQADYLAALNETALGLLNRSELRPLLESILTRACDLINTKHGCDRTCPARWVRASAGSCP